MAAYKDTLAKCELLIRRGQLSAARSLLSSLPPSKVPAEFRLQAAQLARRTGQLHLGFRLLRGQIDFKAKRNRHQAALLAEYCVLLIQNGNVEEALRFLEKAELGLHPALLLAKAWAMFEKWEYQPAIPLLKNYVLAQNEPYLRLAGKINLAEAYVATGKNQEALRLLHPSIKEAEALGHVRMLGNGLHLRARAYFSLGQGEKSESDLSWAMKIYGRKNASDAILIRRQLAINEAAKKGNPKPLQLFREEALAARDWESVRECDFQMLSCRFQSSLFLRLYFGTPYAAFRTRMEKALGRRSLPESFLRGPRDAPCLNLSAREFHFKGRELRLTKQNFALLHALASDFYRPLSVGGIFGALFPHEHFDPVLSPVRVHQSIKRLREWIAANEIPIRIDCEGQWYFLRLAGKVSLSVPLRSSLSDALSRPLQHLASTFPVGTFFTSSAAKERLRISKASVNRLLAQAQADGALLRKGQGKRTLYHFPG